MTFKSIVHNPHRITDMFEEEVAEYTGAPYAVAVDSCTNALFLCLKYAQKFIPLGDVVPEIIIPKETYVSVPQTIINAGHRVGNSGFFAGGGRVESCPNGQALCRRARVAHVHERSVAL